MFSDNGSFSRDVTFTLENCVSITSGVGYNTIIRIPLYVPVYSCYTVDAYDLPTLQGRIAYERGDRPAGKVTGTNHVQ